MEGWLANNYQTLLIIIAGGGLVFGIGKWAGAVNTDRDSFKTFMTRIEEKIDRIFDRLPRTPVKSESPVTLTDFGQDISSQLEVARWARDHAPQVRTQAQGKEEYQVYDLCVEHVRQQMGTDKNLEDRMRAGAYQIGTELENVRKVYEVELRDAVLRLLGT